MLFFFEMGVTGVSSESCIRYCRICMAVIPWTIYLRDLDEFFIYGVLMR